MRNFLFFVGLGLGLSDKILHLPLDERQGSSGFHRYISIRTLEQNCFNLWTHTVHVKSWGPLKGLPHEMLF